MAAQVLRTSHTEWHAERIPGAYWDLTEGEATFRALKSELGLRPNPVPTGDLCAGETGGASRPDRTGGGR